MRRWQFLVLLCPLVPAGCKAAERHISDSEGRVFAMRCERERCSLAQSSGVAAPTSKPELMLRAPGRLIGVCNTAAGSEPDPSDCRPVPCKAASDCPPMQGLDHGECLNGWCIEASHSIGVPDAVMLCLAGTGLGRETALQVERYALALNCGEPCRIPAPCRQP